MYNPQRFKSVNQNEAFDLMDRHPFATVIVVAEGKPIISHLPLTPKKVGDKIELIGHMAKANPQWKYFVDSQVTAIFHGAHTYITPEWYADGDVPTWNYSVVHIKGKVELIESYEGLVNCLKDLTIHVERHWPSGWDFFIPADLSGDILTKSIMGFRISTDEIAFKKKLSQNRSALDRVGIFKGLEGRPDAGSKEVLADMLELYSSNGELK